MQLRVYEGREFPLKVATNASQSISKEILLIFSEQEEELICLYNSTRGRHSECYQSKTATVKVYIALLCARDCLACFLYLIPSSDHTYEVGTSIIPLNKRGN